MLRTAVVAAVLAAAMAQADELALRSVAPGVYVHLGQHADVDDAGRGDSANLGVIVGTRCAAVIDSGGSIVTGTAFAAAIRRLTDTPVCYVINTHVHFDHVLGNAAFAGPDVTFVGHRELADALAANRAYFAEAFAEELGGPGKAAAVIGPTQLVDDRTELDLGERKVVVAAVPTAHTSTDVTVLDVETDVLFAGDLLFRERMPVLDGSLRGWIAWLEAAMAQPHAVVVPGHGPPDTAWPEGAAAQQRYLAALLRDVRAAVASGALPDEAAATVAAGETAGWLLPGRAHRVNVSRALRELEWE
jgi:quinoprotein relay system zinc metallohydrolase 2